MKMILLQGGLYTLIAALTPVAGLLAGDQPLTTRSLICLVIGSIIAGANALKAFLSTSNTPNGK